MFFKWGRLPQVFFRTNFRHCLAFYLKLESFLSEASRDICERSIWYDTNISLLLGSTNLCVVVRVTVAFYVHKCIFNQHNWFCFRPKYVTDIRMFKQMQLIIIDNYDQLLGVFFKITTDQTVLIRWSEVSINRTLAETGVITTIIRSS